MITAIIAAYNEETTIAEVIAALERSPKIDEIIVVSDGSTDRTVEISRRSGVRTLALARNSGKGHAMRLGVQHASHDVLFFVDGDMLNLSDEHIDSLVDPVLAGECDMNVGVRYRGPIRNFLHVRMGVGPILSGIRVMHRSLFEVVPVRFMACYKIETALNYFCDELGFRQKNTIIRGLGHVIKESKRGVLSGLWQRWEMSREVTLLLADLYVVGGWQHDTFVETPHPEYEVL